MGHEFELRVYYEDTDAAGIVYYANYLKFIERARTEALLAAGLSQTLLRDELGVVFAVREAHAEYLAPARLEDRLIVKSRVTEVSGARIKMAQDVMMNGIMLARCAVVLVALGLDGRPRRIPEAVRRALAGIPREQA
jgi:acyl-CoA thioester hydrolase